MSDCKSGGCGGEYEKHRLPHPSPKPGQPHCSCERQIQIADRLVDLLRALEADRDRIHARVLEREPHRSHTIVMTVLELTATAEFHADHTQPFLLQLLDVIHHFAHVGWMVGVLGG